MLRDAFEVNIRRQDAKLPLLLDDLGLGQDDAVLRQVGPGEIVLSRDDRFGGAVDSASMVAATS